ncbi:hypothetical protein Tco_0625494 [Tanacetum coccineum]|uniref:Reverse transcriptase domain-containing protein n=1 Tax=Tanacetum coccineum TaxID=301880 RepID=A0ABQ4WH00_9ASTR
MRNEPLAVLLDGLHLDDKLHFVEEPLEVVGREVKRLKQSRIPLVKVRWNSKRGLEFTWEREDQFKKKYPHLFTKTTPSSSAASVIFGVNGYVYFTPITNLDKENQTNKMVNESLTAELERYKERVAIFEQRQNVDLNKCEKLIDSQMDDLIRNRNAKLAALQQEIDTLKEALSNHVKEKESL